MDLEPAAREALAQPLLGVITQFVAEARGAHFDVRSVSLDSLLDRDLGIDSLARVEIVLRIERALGVRLPDEAFADARTPRDLLHALRPSDYARPVPGPAGEAAFAHPPAVEFPPLSAATLIDVLDWHENAHPERVHLTLIGESGAPRTLAYGELAQRAKQVAGGLQALGVAEGQSVALMLPTSLEFFTSFFGILVAGAVPVPMYPPMRWEQAGEHMRRQAGILASSDATVLITDARIKPLAWLVQAEVSGLHHTVTHEELLARSQACRRPEYRANELALLQYTSGSTGDPRGVMLTHVQLLANVRAMGAAAAVTSDDVFVSWLPLYHDMGLIGAWLGSLFFGMSLVAASPLTFLARPARWLQFIHRYRGSISAAPNFAYEICATKVHERDLQGLDLTSWRWAFNGAEPVSPDTLERFAARYAPYGFRREALAPVYGLAECGLDLCFPPPGRGPQIEVVDRHSLARDGWARLIEAAPGAQLRFVSCGRPLSGYQVRIVDEQGADLPERQQGRIEFRGPSATGGYFHNAPATQALFDRDWLDTGDLGYLAAGELYVTGRSKDMMIRGGQNLYPYELEEAIGRIPGVRKGCVAVFSAQASPGGGERIVVVAETRETGEQRRRQLHGAIDALAVDLIGGTADDVVLAPPHSVLKTSSGKLRRAAMRTRYEQGYLGPAAPPVWRQLLALAGRAAAARLRRVMYILARPLYGLWLWTALGILVLAALIGAFMLRAEPRRRTLRGLARLMTRATGIPLRGVGLEHVPSAGPAVVVVNHASYVDAILLYGLLPPQSCFVAKESLAKRPFVRWFLSATGTRFVERLDPRTAVEDTRHLVDLVRRSGLLIMFPEGTFSAMPGLLPFRMGAFVIAEQTGAPLIPMALRGTRTFLRDGSWWPRRGGEFVLTVGTALHAASTGWEGALQLRKAAREWILRGCGEPDLELGAA